MEENATKKITVIRVVTLNDSVDISLHGRLIEQYYPTVHVESYCISEQPMGICSHETKALAIPKIIALAKEHSDSDAIVISCCDDPAVDILSNELSVPVIGAGSSVCKIAKKLGKRVGIIGITDYAPEPYVEILGDNLINLGCPENVSCTHDLLTDAGKNGVYQLADKLKSAGSYVIALACTGMSTIAIDEELEKYCGLPVVDPVKAEAMYAYIACGGHAVE